MPSPETSSPGSRRALWIVVSLLVAAGLLLWLWPRPRAPRKVAVAEPARLPVAPARPPQLTEALPANPLDAIPESVRYRSFVQGRPLMDEVTLEPKRVCAGQPFVITIAAHDPDHQDDNTVIVGINGDRGSPWVGVLEHPGPRQVLAQAFNHSGDYEQRPVTFNVESCADAVPMLSVSSIARAVGQWAFSVQLPAGAEAAGPYVFSWDLGDGSKAETRTPFLEHDYFDRPVNRLFSSFVVKVTARSLGDGSELQGLTGVSVLNAYYLNRVYKGMVVPDVTVEDAALVGDEVVVHAVVRQHEPEVLTADVTEARAVGCGAAPATALLPTDLRLSTTHFASGATPLELRLPLARLGDGCGLAVVMSGSTPKDRLPIVIDFGAQVRRPPPDDPTNRTIADDTDNPFAQAQIKRLEAAAKALHRGPGEVITDDEMIRLEAEGVIPPLPATDPH